MKHSDLAKRIDKLERRLGEVEKRPVEQHWHFHPPVYYPSHYVQPYVPPPTVPYWQPYWYTTCGATNVENTATTVSAAQYHNITYTA